jgi:hypothetical protein
MATTSIRTASPEVTPKRSSRAERALELYRTRGRDIERISPDVYLVPSCTGEGVYRVDYAAESCSCRDYEIRRDVCKHVLAVGILRAKRRGATARHLDDLEDQLRHELMDEDERLELRERIIRLRRRLGL